jgi:D-sedoheptulose 7-phosphate isomerase
MHPTSISNVSATGYLAQFARLLENVSATDQLQSGLDLDDAANRVVHAIVWARRQRRKVLLIGNGGSAAIVSHLHNDLSKAAGVRALVFNEQPLLTAIANDEGYDNIFAHPIELWADPGDVLIAVSSSGASTNIIAGAEAALAAGASVITLSGFLTSNPLRQRGHVNFYVPGIDYGLVEQTHSVLTHYFSDATAEAVGRQLRCSTPAKPDLLAA